MPYKRFALERQTDWLRLITSATKPELAEALAHLDFHIWRAFEGDIGGNVLGTKISALTYAPPAQATDEIVIARGGHNFKLRISDLG